MSYTAPVNELRFGIRVHGRLDEILQLPHAEGLDAETVDAVLDEAARFASEQWADTNRTGDLHGAGFSDNLITTHPDLARAYYDFCEAGWAGLRAPAEFGGQGLPAVVSAACEEMWCAANLALSLMPMLTLGAVDALFKHGSEEQKQTYLPKMCSGEWAGTMNLSEPQAGSDLNHIATRAVPKENGAYALSGQKIFITWGDQEMTENIVHLVLARLPDAAPGVQGVSMFIVPKYLVNADGSLGGRNGVRAIGIEHKLGIHASPTCTMEFDNAEGYLVGRAGKGLAYMFTMMKTARLNVGIEGHAVAERAYQNALAYAKERVQGRDETDGSDDVAIIRHPDVRRMLLIQKATLAAQRALYLRAAALTLASRRQHSSEATTAVILTAFFSLGIVISLRIGDMSGQLESLMFGRLLDITTSRMWVSAIVLVAAGLVLAATWRAQIAVAFDREAARVAGVSTLVIDAIFNAALGAIVVAASTAVGVLLVVGYLIVPGAFGRLLSAGTRSMAVLASLSALVGGWGGFAVALVPGPRPLSPQACVALGVLACFGLACALRPVIQRRGPLSSTGDAPREREALASVEGRQ